jgi:hypothetical protein
VTAGGDRISKTVGPPAGVVIDAHDLEGVVGHPVGNDEWRFGDEEFAGARYAAEGATQSEIGSIAGSAKDAV